MPLRKNKSNILSSFGRPRLFMGIGSYVTCKSDSNSFFCSLTKITSIIMQFIILGVICYVVYYIIRYHMLRK